MISKRIIHDFTEFKMPEMKQMKKKIKPKRIQTETKKTENVKVHQMTHKLDFYGNKLKVTTII